MLLERKMFILNWRRLLLLQTYQEMKLEGTT